MRTALLAGSLGVVTLIGALFAYNRTKKVLQIPRQKVLQTAKLIRERMYMTLVDVSYFVKQNASKFPPDQLRQFVLSQQGTFMSNIKQKLSNVFKDFTEQQYQQNIEKYYKDDAQVQYHLKRYQQQFDKAVLGVTPQFKQQIITFIDAQKLLKITKQLLQQKMSKIKQSITEKVTFQQMVLILKTQKQQEKISRSLKLKQLGLIGKDQQLAKIYEFSVAKLSKMDQQFNKKYQQLLEDFKIKTNQYVDGFCAFPRSTSKKSIGVAAN